jgi:hypothetical protein
MWYEERGVRRGRECGTSPCLRSVLSVMESRAHYYHMHVRASHVASQMRGSNMSAVLYMECMYALG